MNMALAETQPELPRIIVGELELIPDACHATWRGKIVRLTTTHMLMVQLLASRQGFAVSYNELHRLRHTEGFHIGDGPDGMRSNVRAMIKRIRKCFQAADPTFDQIENHNGFGYRWRA